MSRRSSEPFTRHQFSACTAPSLVTGRNTWPVVFTVSDISAATRFEIQDFRLSADVFLPRRDRCSIDTRHRCDPCGGRRNAEPPAPEECGAHTSRGPIFCETRRLESSLACSSAHPLARSLSEESFSRGPTGRGKIASVLAAGLQRTMRS